ncbi:MAG: type I glyceraldehyde-3-phosphate dehydrogenase [Pirellulaceae bacterium]
MAIRVAINGFGRIGRLTARVMKQRGDEIDLVAINDLTSTDMLANLFKYDSAHGRYEGEVSHDKDNIIIDGDKLRVLKETDPAKLPWKDMGVDIVIESTGRFTGKTKDGKSGYDAHITAGAKKVILSAPAKDKPDLTCVIGVNHKQLTKEMQFISNASCTTNCLAPIAKVLHESFGILSGLMTTVHAYTNDQRLQDLAHDDAYRARAAGVNIIPSSTGAAKAVGEVLPDLKGKLTGIALRVPVVTGSVVDLTANLRDEVTKDQVNAAMKAASVKALKDGGLEGILGYSTDPLVSSDIVHDPRSSIFVPDWTIVLGDKGKFVKVMSWYDNEWGYSSRTADLVVMLGKLL